MTVVPTWTSSSRFSAYIKILSWIISVLPWRAFACPRNRQQAVPTSMRRRAMALEAVPRVFLATDREPLQMRTETLILEISVPFCFAEGKSPGPSRYQFLSSVAGLGFNTATLDRRKGFEQKLAEISARKPMRMDYQNQIRGNRCRLQSREGSHHDRRDFRRLVELVNSLNDEQKRATREGLGEDELALFDLLRKDGLENAWAAIVTRA